MLDIRLIRQEPESVAANLRRQGSSADLDALLAQDTKARTTQTELDALRAERNAVTDEIAKLKKAKDPAADARIAEMKALGERIKGLEATLAEAEAAREELMLALPNLVDPSVPEGLDEDGNVEVKVWGTPRDFAFAPKAHHELGEAAGGLDFERAAKLAGARFVLMRQAYARLERAVMNLFLDRHTANGYEEMAVPFVANADTMTANGNLPKFADQLFKLEGWPYYLIPTAEIPLTNVFRGEILDEAALPLWFTAGTPCFRSEAGAAGRDTKGMIRVHQFDKVELVKICSPETSNEELAKMVLDAEAVLQLLELPYRIVERCAGDSGNNAAKGYDLEVWFPSQGKYREISSCSNCTDYQARRGGLRYRNAAGKIAHPHTLNGSGVAVGRAVAALLENHQQEDGSIQLPAALVPYMGGVQVIPGPKARAAVGAEA